ncbi:MAG: YcgL domain-containing protein [Xanthomonadaceae bacterium]|nr:YcgL domain-containing protein [Xanthomonadaceae bacterium]
MQAYVYKSGRKSETYVYFAVREDFSALPESLQAELGALRFVLEIALSPERKLARAETGTVMDALRAQGFYIQFPPPPDHLVSPSDV